MNSPIYGGIEAGGTKFVCAVGTASGDILAKERLPTAAPDDAPKLGQHNDEILGAEPQPLKAQAS